MSTRFFIVVKASIASIYLAASPLSAQPTEVAYQGELRQHGIRFTGIAQMKFAIVKGCPAQCVSLWSNDSMSVAGTEPSGSVDVTVTNGVFSIYLGAPPMKPLASAALTDGSGAALRVWVRTGAVFEQLSDQKIASVPFALRSEASTGGGDSTWRAIGSNIYRASGRVGIGTPDPGTTLDVNGVTTIHTQVVGGPAIEIANTSGTRIVSLGSFGGGPDINDDSGDLRIFDSANREAVHLTGAPNQSNWITGGRLGINTIRPGTTLDVNGVLTARSQVVGGPAVEAWNVNGTRILSLGSHGGGSELNDDSGELRIFDSANNEAVRLTTARNQVSWIAAGGNVGIGTTTPSTALEVNGETTTRVLAITGGSDLAEPFRLSPSENVCPGTVLSIDPGHPGHLAIARQPYDHRVAGVVSGANGISTGMVMTSVGRADVGGTHNVALSGRVYVRATASNGAIQAGDLLTTSDQPGLAMKATDIARARGAVIGKAMSRLDAGEGLVLLLVQPQ